MFEEMSSDRLIQGELFVTQPENANHGLHRFCGGERRFEEPHCCWTLNGVPEAYIADKWG